MRYCAMPNHPHRIAMPRHLRRGDLIRFVSPASPPDREQVEASAESLRRWGFRVDFGAHAFHRLNYLAGTDEERLSDFNDSLRDPEVRAVFATRGGKGSYRIADRIDHDAARNDPKFIVGFSDIAILQMALWKHGIGGAIHGAMMAQDERNALDGQEISLRQLLLGVDEVILRARQDEDTIALTTGGSAQGPLVGGNLDMVATAAGWALPRLDGCILLLEAVDMFLGQVDRQLTMLRKAGHLDGVAAVAVGQFTDFKSSGSLTIVDLLRDHFSALGVPVLGGLPLGHGKGSLCIPMGCPTRLDADSRQLKITVST